MISSKIFRGMSKTSLIIIFFLTLSLFCSFTVPALADDSKEAEQVVEKARFLMQNFMADANLEAFHDMIKKAKAAFIIPDLLKGAFIVGASGGNGVLLVADEKTGRWEGPAFYTVGGASFGFQIGGQASEVVILVMTERGISSFLSNSLKLGLDVGIAAGPIGVGGSAATANLSADLISFARSKGLYGGVSLDGSVVAVREGLNTAFYGKKVTPTDILIRKQVSNPQAIRLIEEVSKAARK